MTYEDYLRRNLFRGVWFRGETLPRPIAKGYGADGKPVDPPPMRWGTRGAGGMVMTIGDDLRRRWRQDLNAGIQELMLGD